MIYWLEKNLVPLANKLGSTRFLVALRDAFVSIIPITMAGSLSILLSSLMEVARDEFGFKTLYTTLKPFRMINDVVWDGTFAIFSLLFAFSWGYHLAKNYEVNGISGGLVAVSSFLMSIANVFQIKLTKSLPAATSNMLADAKLVLNDKTLAIHDVISIEQLSTTGLITAIVFGGIGVAIFIVLLKARVALNFREPMPRASAIAFEALIPAVIALFCVAGINYLFTTITGTYFGEFLIAMIQKPLLKAGQSFGMVMLVTVLVQIFWFFGINGVNVLAPVLDTIWLPAQNFNTTALKNHGQLDFNWVRGSFDAYAWFGGAGGTLLLIIAILCFSKRKEQRTLAKITLAPQIFNINEPVMYGLPIVLNPLYLIPFLVAPVVNVALAYIVTQLGWVNPVQVVVPHLMPPVLQAFLATNMDWRAAVLAVVNMVIAFLIWTPFVFAANKVRPTNYERNFNF